MTSSMAPAWVLAGSTSAVSMLACIWLQQAQAARQFRIARARARGVDHDELAAAQLVQQLGQLGDVEDVVRGDA